MKKVLHIVSSMNRGGLESFIMNVYRVIDREMIQFDFLVTSEINAFSDEIGKLGGNIYKIQPRRKGLNEYRKSLRDFFLKHKDEYIAVHQHSSSLSSIYPLVLAKKMGVPNLIIHSHNSSITSNKLHYILHYINKLRIRNYATIYLACSDLARTWLFKGTGKYNQSMIINNGILTKDYSFDPIKREHVRNKLKIDGSCIALCHVGRFSRVKNHSFLLEIFKELLKKSNDYHLYLVGDGELREDILLKAKTLSIEKKITFLGVRDDVNYLMNGFDGLLFPSLYEGLPVTLVEAQASDLPVFCSDTISNTSKLTEKVYFISLSYSANKWTEIINDKIKTLNRQKNDDIIKSAGYDISETADILKKLYLNI